MSSANTTVDQEKFGGQMSKGEALYCNQLRELLHATREGRISFRSAMTALVSDLHELWKADRDIHELWKAQHDAAFMPDVPDGAKASAWSVICANREKTDGAKPHAARPSELEIAFLDDIDGLIDYAMRNGIDFAGVVDAIGHDVNEIRQHDWSLETAEKERYFCPRVTGWASRNKEVFGESDVELE